MTLYTGCNYADNVFELVLCTVHKQAEKVTTIGKALFTDTQGKD